MPVMRLKFEGKFTDLKFEGQFIDGGHGLSYRAVIFATNKGQSCMICHEIMTLAFQPGSADHLYLRHSILCSRCARLCERRFIEELPYEDLPLWVSQQWMYTEHDKIFRHRLEMGV